MLKQKLKKTQPWDVPICRWYYFDNPLRDYEHPRCFYEMVSRNKLITVDIETGHTIPFIVHQQGHHFT